MLVRFTLLKEDSFAHLGCIYLIKNIVLHVIFFLYIFKNVMYSCNGKDEFPAAINTLLYKSINFFINSPFSVPKVFLVFKTVY